MTVALTNALKRFARMGAMIRTMFSSYSTRHLCWEKERSSGAQELTLRVRFGIYPISTTSIFCLIEGRLFVSLRHGPKCSWHARQIGSAPTRRHCRGPHDFAIEPEVVVVIVLRSVSASCAPASFMRRCNVGAVIRYKGQFD